MKRALFTLVCLAGCLGRFGVTPAGGDSTGVAPDVGGDPGDVATAPDSDDDADPDPGDEPSVPTDLDGGADPDVGDAPPPGDLPADDASPPPPIAVIELEQFFPTLSAGQWDVPLRVHFDNPRAVDVTLVTVQLVFSRDAGAFTLDPPDLPLTLPAAGTTPVLLYLALAASTPPGPIELNATGTVVDLTRGSTELAEPLATAAQLLVTAPPPPPADSDGDGLTNAQEAAIGTDPANPDTDSDGLDDAAEAATGASDLDGTIDALDDDSDDGGEPDLLEGWRGADPTDPGDDTLYALLTVNDLSDDWDGGASANDVSQTGATLSLREALTIAQNRLGPDRIAFDPSVFVPGAHITIGSVAASAVSVLPLLSDADTFIDGGGARIRWPVNTRPVDYLFRPTAARVLIRGLTIDFLPTVTTYGANAYAVFGDATTGLVVASLTLLNTALQGNSAGRVLGCATCIDTLVYRCLTSPRLSTGLGVQHGIDFTNDTRGLIWRSLVEVTGISLSVSGDFTAIRESAFAGTSGTAIYLSSSDDLVFEKNLVYQTTERGLSLSYVRTTTFSDNIFANIGGPAIVFDYSANNPMRRNRFLNVFGNGFEPVVFFTNAQGNLASPVIGAVDFVSVSGVHPGADGTEIEVFVGPSNAPGSYAYLGTTLVSGGVWRLDLPLPLPRGTQVTATATDAVNNTSRFATPMPTN